MRWAKSVCFSRRRAMAPVRYTLVFVLKKTSCFFCCKGKYITPCQFLCGTVLRLLSSIERGTPSGGAPAHFASFYPFYSLQAFTAALRASVSLQSLCLRVFPVQARLARLLRASRASECVFQCKHGWYRFEAIRRSGYLRQHVKFPPWCLRQIAYLPHYSLSSLQSVHSVAVNAL